MARTDGNSVLAYLGGSLLAIFGVSALWAFGQTPGDLRGLRPDEPFHTLVRQQDPPVRLFEHRGTQTCFLLAEGGSSGLMMVPWTLCEQAGARPVSPER